MFQILHTEFVVDFFVGYFTPNHIKFKLELHNIMWYEKKAGKAFYDTGYTRNLIYKMDSYFFVPSFASFAKNIGLRSDRLFLHRPSKRHAWLALKHKTNHLQDNKQNKPFFKYKKDKNMKCWLLGTRNSLLSRCNLYFSSTISRMAGRISQR